MNNNEKNRRVLLVDDDPSTCKLLSVHLHKAGYTVLQAEHGLAGLELLDQQEIDLIVLDLMMPVMDGLRFLRELRENRHSDLPVLVLTATAAGSGDDPEQDILASGATRVAYKPIKARELLALLETL